MLCPGDCCQSTSIEFRETTLNSEHIVLMPVVAWATTPDIKHIDARHHLMLYFRPCDCRALSCTDYGRSWLYSATRQTMATGGGLFQASLFSSCSEPLARVTTLVIVELCAFCFRDMYRHGVVCYVVPTTDSQVHIRVRYRGPRPSSLRVIIQMGGSRQTVTSVDNRSCIPGSKVRLALYMRGCGLCTQGYLPEVCL